MGKFAASIECSKTKNASASGGFAPLAPDQGLCPQTPVIGSRYHARHGAVPPKFCGLEPPLFCGIQLLREKPRLT